MVRRIQFAPPRQNENVIHLVENVNSYSCESQSEIKIYDINGQLVMRVNKDDLGMNLEEQLLSGFYLVVKVCGEDVITKKIFVP